MLRQGDVWIVECSRQDAMSGLDLPPGHTWDPETRTVHHRAHAPAHVAFPAIALRTSALDAHTGARGRHGD